MSKQQQMKKEMAIDLLWLLTIITPPITIALIAIYKWDFMVDAIKSNKVINLSIIINAFIAAVLIVIRLVKLQRDGRLMARFRAEAEETGDMYKVLAQPWLVECQVRHYLAHIAETGGTLSSEVQQNAIEEELRHLASDYAGRKKIAKRLTDFMIAMGLLGTFAGFLEALGGIKETLSAAQTAGTGMDEKIGQIIGGLTPALGGMGTAFTASMMGLICNQMLQFMLVLLDSYTGRVLTLARNVMRELMQTVRGPSNGKKGTSLSPDEIEAMMRSEGGGYAEADDYALPMHSKPLVALTAPTMVGPGGTTFSDTKLDALLEKVSGIILMGERVEARLQSATEVIKQGFESLGDKYDAQKGVLVQIAGVVVESTQYSQELVLEHRQFVRENSSNNMKLSENIGRTANGVERILTEYRNERQQLVEAFDVFSRNLMALQKDQGAVRTALEGVDEKTSASIDALRILAEKCANHDALLSKLGDYVADGGDQIRLSREEQSNVMRQLLGHTDRLREDGSRIVRTIVGALAQSRTERAENSSLFKSLDTHFANLDKSGSDTAHNMEELSKEFTKLCHSTKAALDEIEGMVRTQTSVVQTLYTNSSIVE